MNRILRSNAQKIQLNQAKYKCVFDFTFIHGDEKSDFKLLVADTNLNTSILKEDTHKVNPLLPPFNDMWSLGQSCRMILESIPPQEIVLSISGKPFVYFYLLRMLSWQLPKHDISLVYNLDCVPSDNFLIEKMNDFVIKTVSNFDSTSKVTFPIDYLDCAKCQDNHVIRNHVLLGEGIDIVVPTMNVEQAELENCIRSILPQMGEEDLIYLVNDNRSDSRVCEKVSEISSRIIVVPGSHAGIASTRNIGARTGKNPLIAFIDSDDFILPTYLQIQRDFHLSYPQVAATGTWIQAFGAHEMIYPQWDGISPLSVLSCLPPAGVLMWKRSAITELNFFREEFTDGFEDFDLVARAVAHNFRIVVHDNSLYRYRRGHSSLSQSWSRTREKELQLKVAGNLQILCNHEFNDYLQLSSKYGTRLLLSHPDLVFGFVSGFRKQVFRYHLNNTFYVVIQKLRNVVLLRQLWNKLNPNLRIKIINFLIR